MKLPGRNIVLISHSSFPAFLLCVIITHFLQDAVTEDLCDSGAISCDTTSQCYNLCDVGDPDSVYPYCVGRSKSETFYASLAL